MEKEAVVDSSIVDDASAHESESVLLHPSPQPSHETESREPETETPKTSTLYIESNYKLTPDEVEDRELSSVSQEKRPVSAGRTRTLHKDEIMQKLDATMQEVTYYRNIVTFDAEINQTFPHRSDSETGKILEHLKEATSVVEKEATERNKRKEDETFTTSVSEEDLEEARKRRERRRLEEQMMWREDPTKPRLSMEQVVEEKVHEHYSRGVVEASEGRFEAALTSFDKALNLAPTDLSCYVERGEAYLQLCDFRSAYLNYKKAHTLQPNNSHLYEKLAFICHLEGQCLFDQGLYTEALECFVRAADLKPNAKGYHLRAITCLAALGRNQECLALVTRRLDAEATGNPELYVLRGRLHRQFGNATLCYYDVRDALSLDPEQPQALEMMREIRAKADAAKQQALELTIQNRLVEALSKMTTAVQTDPSMAEHHVLRGALYRRMKNFNSAIDDYLLAMDKSDHNEASPVYLAAQRQLLLTYNDFAVHCYHREFYEEAVILLNKAIKGEKHEKGLYVNRGDCFFKLNNLVFALADYQQALDIDPGCWDIKCRISVVQNEFGIGAYQERVYEDAKEFFTAAIDHNNKVGQFYVHRARALYMMEEVEGARRDILVALHLDPDNDELIPLISRLFPGRTVSEVLQSKAAEGVRSELASTITPHSKLPPMSRRSSSRQSSTKKSKRSMRPHFATSPSPQSTPMSDPLTNEEETLTSAEVTTPEARHLPSDREIIEAKKAITGELKNIFTFPLSLKSTQPKVLSSVPPVRQRAGGLSKSEGGTKLPYNWNKFGMKASSG